MIVNTKAAKKHMINSQLETNQVNDERIISAIKKVAREDFVPENYKRLAYIDADILLGEGRYLLQTLTFARMLVAADIKENDSVLDIASGTGYSTAVISHLCKKVLGIETSTKLTSVAISNITKMGLDNISFAKAEIKNGFSKQAPFDVIIVNGQVGYLPKKLLEQIKNDGRLVAIASDGFITTYQKSGKALSEVKSFQVNTKAVLREFRKKKRFVF